MKSKALIILSFVLLICATACTKNEIENKLIGANRDKYWDFLYSTNILSNNHSANIYRVPNYCIIFKKTKSVIHYAYKDSSIISDRGCNTDIKYNPDTYLIKNDSVINFSGDDYLIYSLTDDKMILKRILEDKSFIFYIYKVSGNQNKQIVDCKQSFWRNKPV